MRVQGNARGTAASGTTVSITQATNPIQGNFCILTSSMRNNTGSVQSISNITQTGVTWTIANSNQYNIDINNYLKSEIWLGTVGSGAGTGITVTYNGTLVGAVCNVCEYSNLTTNPLDNHSGNNIGNTANPLTGTTGTIAQANELVIGCTTALGYVQSSPINSFNLLDGANYNSYVSNGYLERFVSSIGTYSSGTTISGANNWCGCIATFKSGGVTRLGLAVKNVAVAYPLIFATRLPKFMVRRF